jgi:hypothetical protein
MTNAQLTAYLQDDSYLFAVSYEELKTLVMQYPYATNLRILLLKKSYLEQNKDYERNLQMAATFSTNRKYLYQVVQKVKSFKSAPQSVILGEDYLELTELSNIEKLLAEKQVADAMGETNQFSSLAADWQLEFGNLETPEDGINTPQIKGIDEEEIEMFELAYNAQIADNQPIESEEDVQFLIDNLVSDFNDSQKEDPSVSAAFEDENLAFELINDYTEKTTGNSAKMGTEITEEALDFTDIVDAPMVETPVKTVLNLSELLAENAQLNAAEKSNKIVENKPNIFDDINDETNDETKSEITEEEMDALLSHSFKSVVREAPDELMATSFAVLKGENPEVLEADFAYSFIDEKEVEKEIEPTLEAVKNNAEHEIEMPIVAIDFEENKVEETAIKQLEAIEAELDKALTSKVLDDKKVGKPVESIVEEPAESNTTKPSIRKVIPNETTEKELANRAAIRLEKEITREAPSHSFRVIKKEIAREVAANSFKVVVKDKSVDKPNLIAEIEAIQPIIEPVDKPNLIAEIESIQPVTEPVEKPNLIAEIESIQPVIEPVDKPNLIAEIEAIQPIIEPAEKLNLTVEIEAVVAVNSDEIELKQQPQFIEDIQKEETVVHEAPPQFILDLEDIAPVVRQKKGEADIIFEKNNIFVDVKGTPQYKDELDRILSAFDNKTDDTEEMIAAKKSDLELEILNEHKVNIGTKPTTETAAEEKSFTEWLRQYRMNQATEAAKMTAYEVELKNRDTLEKELDNQILAEKEANRKSIKQNLDALFEVENDVPEHIFSFLEPTEEKVQKTLPTATAADLIRQHLNPEMDEEMAAPMEKKKKKKKKEMHELAARSIEEDSDMVSETLADLLVWQGKTGKAIDMYEKLSLAFPDKRTYFASKIETIKSNAA